MLLYLDDRVCVPRDMGAPVAHCIGKLRRQVETNDHVCPKDEWSFCLEEVSISFSARRFCRETTRPL
eukprot:scaffold2500_cov176-Amphora_coffeaeformis.AAC.12